MSILLDRILICLIPYTICITLTNINSTSINYVFFITNFIFTYKVCIEISIFMNIS